MNDFLRELQEETEKKSSRFTLHLATTSSESVSCMGCSVSVGVIIAVLVRLKFGSPTRLLIPEEYEYYYLLAMFLLCIPIFYFFLRYSKKYEKACIFDRNRQIITFQDLSISNKYKRNVYVPFSEVKEISIYFIKNKKVETEKIDTGHYLYESESSSKKSLLYYFPVHKPKWKTSKREYITREVTTYNLHSYGKLRIGGSKKESILIFTHDGENAVKPEDLTTQYENYKKEMVDKLNVLAQIIGCPISIKSAEKQEISDIGCFVNFLLLIFSIVIFILL